MKKSTNVLFKIVDYTLDDDAPDGDIGINDKNDDESHNFDNNENVDGNHLNDNNDDEYDCSLIMMKIIRQ